MLRLLRHFFEIGVFAGIVGTTLWVFASLAGVVGGALISDIAQAQCFTWLMVLVSSALGCVAVRWIEFDQPRYVV